MDKTDKQDILDAINALAAKVATKEELAAVKAELKAEIAQTRHETAAAHWRLMGRTDEMREMLRAHICDPHAHKPPAAAE